MVQPTGRSSRWLQIIDRGDYNRKTNAHMNVINYKSSWELSLGVGLPDFIGT